MRVVLACLLGLAVMVLYEALMPPGLMPPWVGMIVLAAGIVVAYQGLERKKD